MILAQLPAAAHSSGWPATWRAVAALVAVGQLVAYARVLLAVDGRRRAVGGPS